MNVLCKLFLVVSLLTLASGCGSDSDNDVDPDPVINEPIEDDKPPSLPSPF